MKTHKIQMNCMDEFCGSKIITRKGEYALDGIKCPVCDGLVMPRPYNEEDDHIYYEDHKKPKLYRQKHECLNCGHDAFIEGPKETHSTVQVCPQCTRGAFVDKWFIHKYHERTIPLTITQRFKRFLARKI
jgi:ribosomal protein S27AE